MGWLAVILFAVVAGAYTGIVGSIPAAEGTSFKDIAISYEWWVIFAVVIASNCTKSWESALKIFVFFLISQPLCFIVEVVFGLSVDQALYYYCSIWGPATLLALPGGFIAYLHQQAKRVRQCDPGFGQLHSGVSWNHLHNPDAWKPSVSSAQRHRLLRLHPHHDLPDPEGQWKPSDIAPGTCCGCGSRPRAHTDDRTRHRLGLRDGARRRGLVIEFMLR